MPFITCFKIRDYPCCSLKLMLNSVRVLYLWATRVLDSFYDSDYYLHDARVVRGLYILWVISFQFQFSYTPCLINAVNDLFLNFWLFKNRGFPLIVLFYSLFSAANFQFSMFVVKNYYELNILEEFF